MEGFLSLFTNGEGAVTLLSAYDALLRIVLPVLALFIVLRSARSLLGFRKEPEVWAWLRLASGELLPVTHWENVIGRKKTADIVVDFATVSKNHAVLTRLEDGGWLLRDIGAKGRVQVNGETMESCEISYGDRISLGGLDMFLEPISAEEKQMQAQTRTKAGKNHSPGLTLVLLSILQLLLALALFLHVDAEDRVSVLFGYGALLALEWILFAGQKIIKRSGFELETIAFFLCSLGMVVVISKFPSTVSKVIITMAAGILLFLIVGWSLRDLERAKRFRYVAAVGGILLLLVNLALGTVRNGAQNWIYIGGFSFQPSELVKVCFVFVGASTLDRLVTKRNLLLFIAYSGFVCICLALMSDFGTALIFFVAFLAIANLRSGSFASITLLCSVLLIVGVALLLAVLLDRVFNISFFIDKINYVLNRFSTWGHIWEGDNPTDSGFQQTRALMCIASGGLFGLGAGNGWLKYVAASETDLVFAFICEELGLLMGAVMIFALGVLVLFAVRSSEVGRSSFYTIAAGTAVTILTVQAILNVFGTVDFLPLTGVTFPFVSDGGSSMIACWGLLAFVKAADTRQNASFAVTLADRKGAAA